MTARVVNKRENWSCKTFIWIDRSGPWGNPFKLGTHGSREAVLQQHEDWLRRTPELVMELWRLEGKALGCWCEPLPCHGWLLAYLANGSWEQQFDWLLGEQFWSPFMLSYRSVGGHPGWRVKLDDL